MMVSSEPQEPEGQPMSWRKAHPLTPGARAVRLMRARKAVEHAVHAIDYTRTGLGGSAVDAYKDLYAKLAVAAKELTEAQDEWSAHAAGREAVK